MSEENISCIYHYTSVDAFEKMLREMKKKETTDITFWASNIHYMNDPNELSFLYDELIDALPELEQHLNVKENHFSMFSAFRKNSNGVSLDLFKDVKDNVFNKIFKNAYAVSFSKQKDFLPMWSLYGCKGAGLCIEFDYESMKKHFNSNPVETRLIEMHYYLKELDIWTKIGAFYHYYHNGLGTNDSKDPLIQCRTFVARVLMELAPLLKNQSYAYEKEVRLFDHFIKIEKEDEILSKAEILPLDKKDLKIEPPKVRVRKGLLIPYREITIPVGFVTKIIVGPTSFPELQSEALKVLLNEVGLDNITVEMSKIPYREM